MHGFPSNALVCLLSLTYLKHLQASWTKLQSILAKHLWKRFTRLNCYFTVTLPRTVRRTVSVACLAGTLAPEGLATIGFLGAWLTPSWTNFTLCIAVFSAFWRVRHCVETFTPGLVVPSCWLSFAWWRLASSSCPEVTSSSVQAASWRSSTFQTCGCNRRLRRQWRIGHNPSFQEFMVLLSLVLLGFGLRRWWHGLQVGSFFSQI